MKSFKSEFFNYFSFDSLNKVIIKLIDVASAEHITKYAAISWIFVKSNIIILAISIPIKAKESIKKNDLKFLPSIGFMIN